MKMKPGQLAALAFLPLIAAAMPAAAQTCTLEYQRADNMWAAEGRPDGALGKETLTLSPGQTKVFVTDWKYEKQRNNGANYYGSHLRIASNVGKQPMKLLLRGDLASIGGALGAFASKLTKVGEDRAHGTLDPGMSWNLKADLMEATCLYADAAKDATPLPQAQAIVDAPSGRVARQVSPTEIVLTWEKVPAAREYRVYVSPPPSPTMAGRPGIVGASGSRYVIPIPPSIPPNTVYQAAIEAVGTNGTVSGRAPFNPVTVVAAGGLGGGPQAGGGTGSPGGGGASSTPGTASPAGQTCPPGQFVTGFSSAGALLCASPPAAR